MADGSIIIDTKIDSGNVGKELASLKTDLKKNVASAAKVAAKALVGVTAAIAGVAAASSKFAQVTDRIDKMSQKIGLSRQAFQEWDFILSQSGASVDGLQTGIKTLSRAADESAKGTKLYAEMFERLGISVKDTNGEMKGQEQLFNEVFASLANMTNETERTAIASQLLGRSATELTPALNAGAVGIERMRKEAHDLGLVMGDDLIDSGVRLTDSIDKAKRAIGAAAVEIAGPFIDSITDTIDAFTVWIGESDGLQNTLRTLLPIIAGVGAALATAFIVSNLGAVIAGITAAVKLLTIAMLANPAFALATAVTGVTAALLVLGKTRRDAKLERIKEQFNDIESAANLAANEIEAIETSISRGAFDVGANALEDVNQLSESLKISREAIVDIGLASQDVTGEYREQLEALKEQINKQKELEILNDADALRNEQQMYRLIQQQERRDEIIRKKQEERRIADEQLQTEREINSILDAHEESRKTEIDRLLEQRDILEKMALSDPEDEARRLKAIQEITAAIRELMAVPEEKGSGKPLLQGIMGEILGKADMDELTSFMPADKGEDVAESFVGSLIGSLKESGPKILSVASKTVGIIVDTFRWGLNTFSRALNWAATFDPGQMVAALQEFADGITNFFMQDLGSLPIFFDQGLQIITDMVSGIMDNLPMIVDTIGNVIHHIGESIIDNGPVLVMSGFEMVLSIIKGIAQNVDKILEAAGVMVISLAQGMLNNIPSIIDAMIDIIIAVFEWSVNNLDLLIDLGIEMVVAIATGIADNFDVIVESLIKALPSIMMALWSMQPKMILASGRIALSFITGLVKGLFAGIKALVEVVFDIGVAIVDAFKSFFGIHSPSTVFADFGGMLIQGLINGISSAGAGLWNAVKSVFSGFMDAVGGLFKGAKNLGAGLVDGIKAGVSGAASGISGLVGGAVSGISGLVGGAVSGIKSIGSGIGKIFGFADGTDYAPGGLSVVGEEGPELMEVPRGSRVIPNGGTEKIMSGVASVMAAVSGFQPGTPQPAGGAVTINNRMTGNVMVDGLVLGRIVYENIDEVAM